MAKRTLTIPTIGDVLTLAQDWTFMVLAEHRNKSLMDYMEETGVLPNGSPRFLPHQNPCGAVFKWFDNDHAICARVAGHPGSAYGTGGHSIYSERREYARYQCTLPRGTRLRVDRIYIRKGKKAYDSVTFWALDLREGAKPAFGPKKAVRFFAKLSDVNTMVVTDRLTPAKPMKTKVGPIRAIRIRDEADVDALTV